MNNSEKYAKVFAETLQLDEDKLNGLVYQSVETWDSVGHMALITALEDTFDIMFDTDDIIAFNSFEKGKELLEKNYGIEF
jgi:acyl carrier protein